jgi:hypothetical protein
MMFQRAFSDGVDDWAIAGRCALAGVKASIDRRWVDRLADSDVVQVGHLGLNCVSRCLGLSSCSRQLRVQVIDGGLELRILDSVIRQLLLVRSLERSVCRLRVSQRLCQVLATGSEPVAHTLNRHL